MRLRNCGLLLDPLALRQPNPAVGVIGSGLQRLRRLPTEARWRLAKNADPLSESPSRVGPEMASRSINSQSASKSSKRLSDGPKRATDIQAAGWLEDASSIGLETKTSGRSA